LPLPLQAPDCYCFSLNTYRRRAVFGSPAVFQKLCLRSGSRIRQKRPSVRARSHAAPLGPRRRHFRACPLARGARGTAPRMLACVPARTRRLRGLQNLKNDSLAAQKCPLLFQAPDCYCFRLNTCRGRAVFGSLAVLEKAILNNFSAASLFSGNPACAAAKSAIPYFCSTSLVMMSLGLAQCGVLFVLRV